jgi:UDP-N-acetylglucosamine 2-epimerase (non-hydrolysing)
VSGRWCRTDPEDKTRRWARVPAVDCREVRPLVAHVVGARPNYMKVAPLYAELERDGAVEQRLIHTGQHYDGLLKDVFFTELPLPRPHVELAVGSGSHAEQTARALVGLEETFLELRPQLVVVPGDVNSTLAGALAAVKLDIPVCHLEAGLRSHDWSMPEEHNRRVADHLSALLLTHSEGANENLRREGIDDSRVRFVGNTMIDTLLASLDAARAQEDWRAWSLAPGEYLLVTLHRPALVDDPERLAQTMSALETVARELPVIFPVHPRTRNRLEHLGIEPRAGVTLTDPLPYRTFLALESCAAAVLTDSGGIQEETTALGVPCFTLRANTERPVTVEEGTNVLLGLEPERILEIPSLLAGDDRADGRPALWDGRAGERAAAAVAEFLAGASRRQPLVERR